MLLHWCLEVCFVIGYEVDNIVKFLKVVPAVLFWAVSVSSDKVLDTAASFLLD